MNIEKEYVEDDIEEVDGYTYKELMDEQRYGLECELQGQIADAKREIEISENS